MKKHKKMAEHLPGRLSDRRHWRGTVVPATQDRREETVPDLYSQGRGRDKRFLESTDPRSQNGSKGIQCRYRHSGTVRGE